MKHSKLLLICFVLFLSFAHSDLFANVFAAHVQLDFDGIFPATIRYRLNEDATSVTIYLKMDNVVVRALSGAGDQLTFGHEASMTWDGLLDNGGTATDGVYTVEIEAASDGHTSWTLLSDRFGIETKQTNVRGVAANKNNGSINFGRVYVLQQQTRLAGAGQFRPRGVWLYRNDLSFWGGSQETAYASGNFYSSLSEYCDISVWCSYFDTETLESITDYEDSNGPFRVTVDAADYVYVSTSLEDALGGITVGDADFSKESVFFLLNRLPVTQFGQDPGLRPLNYCYYDENANLYVGGAYNAQQGVSEYHSLQKFHPEGDSYVLDWERIIPNTIQTMGIAYDPRSNRLAVTDLETLGYIRIFNTETGAIDDEFSTWEYALRNNLI